MAVTRLERKVKKNRINAQNRQRKLKHLLRKPVIKKIDIDAIKQAFSAQATTGADSHTV